MTSFKIPYQIKLTRPINILWLLAVLFLATPVVGQNDVLISGQVTDAENGNSLPYATVILKSKSIGTISDVDGNFLFHISEAKDLDTIIVSFVGYKPVQTTVAASLNRSVYSLNPVVNEIDEVVVTPEKINTKNLIKEAIHNYNASKRKESHLAIAHYWETASKDSEYIMFTESIGYNIYAKLDENSSPLSNYNFFYENTKCKIDNPSWKSYTKNITGFTRETVPLAGSSNLNLFRMFETRGILSDKIYSKYKYDLDSSYFIGNSLVYVVQFKGKGDHGRIHLFANDKHLLKIECTTNKLWSSAFHKRVNSKADFMFNYFDNVPFMSEIRTEYELEGLTHTNFMEVLVQKFFGFDLNFDEYWSLSGYTQNPYILYRPADYQEYQIKEVTDFVNISGDLASNKEDLENYFVSKSGNWLNNERRRQQAVDIIKSLKQNF